MAAEDVSIFLGIVSIGVAVGMSIFMLKRDSNRRKREENFYANEIKENLKTITQYFLTIDSISSDYRGLGKEENETTLSLNDYYVRHHQEMIDLQHITKLYLTQWKTLDQEKKELTKKILKEFSWLSYEYYPLHLPESIKNSRWQSSEEKFNEKREFVANNVPIILNENN